MGDYEASRQYVSKTNFLSKSVSVITHLQLEDMILWLDAGKMHDFLHSSNITLYPPGNLCKN
jgi:hypothetical protein